MNAPFFRLAAVTFAALLFVSTPHPPPSKAASQAPPLVLQHATVIDGLGGEPLRDATLIVRDGKIEALATGALNLPAGAIVLDLKDRWLLPGFIDAHTHIADLQSARAALASGVTTARNMGISHFVDIGIRELNRGGAGDLPDMLSAGYHIYPRPREGLFLDFPQLRDLMKGVAGAADVRRIVRLQIERGVNFIKVNATDRAGQPESDPRKQLYSEEEMAAIVDEARKSGIYVAAHAHGDEGALAAVRAGVRSIEHGTYLTDRTLALMKERGTYLAPTLATMAEMLEARNDVALQIRGKHMVPRIRDMAARSWRMGLKIIAGTDTDYGPTSNFRLPHEMMELAACGMPAMETIKAATSRAAECFGIEKRTGVVRAGLEADLIVVERDPLASVANLQDVLLVINNGRIAVNRL